MNRAPKRTLDRTGKGRALCSTFTDEPESIKGVPRCPGSLAKSLDHASGLANKPGSLRLFEIGPLPFARLGLLVVCAIAVPKLRDPSQGAAPARPVLPIRSSHD